MRYIRRQERTRQRIFGAFITVLERNSFESITVQDILNEAKAGRCTFYSNFDTKYDLVRALSKDMLRRVFNDGLELEDSSEYEPGLGYPVGEYDFPREITQILCRVQENSKNLKVLLSSDCADVFMNYFKNYVYELFVSYSGSQQHEAPSEYVLSISISCFAETMRWWITKHNEYTPEEIAAFFIEYIN